MNFKLFLFTCLLISVTTNTFCQEFLCKSSIDFSYEKFFIEKSELYNQTGPASFYSKKSEGYRLNLGYSIFLKKTNQITFTLGYGSIKYRFGLDIKPYQYPENKNFYCSSDYIPVNNYSLGISYSKNIWSKNHFNLNLSAGFDLYYQGRMDTLKYFTSSNAKNWPRAPIYPDTLYYDYRITSFKDTYLYFTPTIALKTEVSYLFKLRHKFSAGIGYRFALSNFASGYYTMFPTTISKSSGEWKLRGNALFLTFGYHFLFYKKATSITSKHVK